MEICWMLFVKNTYDYKGLIVGLSCFLECLGTVVWIKHSWFLDKQYSAIVKIDPLKFQKTYPVHSITLHISVDS